jgi:hypothetical protein
MNIILLFLFLCIGNVNSAQAQQAQLTLEDFAYGRKLEFTSGSAIYTFSIPAKVYQTTSKKDLGDLRVFNSQGIVPHLIRSPRQEEIIRQPQAIPFFPLPEEKENYKLPANLQIKTNSQGTIIDISQHLKTDKTKTAPGSYLLDLTKLKAPSPQWLELDWPETGNQFTVSLPIYASMDLNSWQPLRSTTIAQLNYAGHTLKRHRISLTSNYKYLRLSWPMGKDGLHLRQVLAGFESEKQKHPLNWLSLSGNLFIGKDNNDKDKIIYHFNTPGHYPIEYIRLKLPEKNNLTQASFLSRSSSKSAWRHRLTTLVYDIMLGGEREQSKAKAINKTKDRYWRLEISKAGGGLGQGIPILELGWRPQQLLFIARGEEPFTLAYGNSKISGESSPVAQMLTSIKEDNLEIPRAVCGSQFTLSNKDLLKPTRDVPWKKLVLWGILISGVILAGSLAFRLFRQMNPK